MQYSPTPDVARRLSTDELRSSFLLTGLFVAGEVNLRITDLDRAVIGGAVPTAEPLLLTAPEALRAKYFNERRELGCDREPDESEQHGHPGHIAGLARMFAYAPAIAGLLPLSPVRKHLLIKDLKVFLRDVSQRSQLLLLVALMTVYLYNFRVLDLERIPYMSGFLKNIYAFLNLAMAAFVMATVAVGSDCW